MFAQTISPQRLPYNTICAGGPHPTIPNAIFNEYQAKFVIDGFASDVVFVVELSNASGAFTNPIATIALNPLPGTDPDTPTNKTLSFAIPTDLVGSDKYQLRVKSSTNVVSNSFTIFGTTSEKSLPVYFKSFDKSFYIADKASSISFCSGGSVKLSVYEDPSNPDSSPLKFPQLKYNWYKNDVLIAGESSNSLDVKSSGIYFAEINYGPCTEINTRSQGVSVQSASGGSGVSITSSLGNPFCSGSEKTTLTATAGNSYIWKKDGVTIPNATGQTYLTKDTGIYTCDIDFGGCTATASIDLKNTGTINANGNVIDDGDTLPINQGDAITVSTTTNASSPSYQWYLNNSAITGAIQSSLDITVAGNYKVNISGCTMSFKVTYGTVIDFNVSKTHNIVSPNGDKINDTWFIQDDYSNKNTHVTILNSFGEIVYETNDYDNYNGWPTPQSNIEFKNFNPVFYYIITPKDGSVQKGSITLLK